MSGERVAAVYELGQQVEAEESSSVHLLPPQTLAQLPRLLHPCTPTGAGCPFISSALLLCSYTTRNILKFYNTVKKKKKTKHHIDLHGVIQIKTVI